MSNALKKIIARAKQLHKKHPNAKWTNMVKQAGQEYRSGKVGAVGATKKKVRQTGTSNKKRDTLRKAKPPGKRKSASGNTYYERRKNRSDKPGTLTGVSASTLANELKARLKKKLGDNYVKRETATSAKAYHSANNNIKEAKAQLRRLQ